MTMYRIKRLAELVDGWRRVSQVRVLVAELTKQLSTGKEPFLRKALPEELVHGRLPPGIESASVFVIRPETRTPPRKHPNSVQHMAVIDGGGTYFIGDKTDFLQPFDPAFPEKSIYVIGEGVPYSFEPGHEPLVLLSFHTVTADKLIEVEVEGERKGTYVRLEGAAGRGRTGALHASRARREKPGHKRH